MHVSSAAEKSFNYPDQLKLLLISSVVVSNRSDNTFQMWGSNHFNVWARKKLGKNIPRLSAQLSLAYSTVYITWVELLMIHIKTVENSKIWFDTNFVKIYSLFITHYVAWYSHCVHKWGFFGGAELALAMHIIQWADAFMRLCVICPLVVWLLNILQTYNQQLFLQNNTKV